MWGGKKNVSERSLCSLYKPRYKTPCNFLFLLLCACTGISCCFQIQNDCNQRLWFGCSEENFYLSFMLVALKLAPLLVVLFLLNPHVSCGLDPGDWSLFCSALWYSDLQCNPFLLWSYYVCCHLDAAVPHGRLLLLDIWGDWRRSALNYTLVFWVFLMLLGWWVCQHHLCSSASPWCVAGAGCRSLMERDLQAPVQLCWCQDIQPFLVRWPLHPVVWLRDAFCISLPWNRN